MSNTSYKESP